MEVFKKHRYIFMFFMCAVGASSILSGGPKRIDLFEGSLELPPGRYVSPYNQKQKQEKSLAKTDSVNYGIIGNTLKKGHEVSQKMKGRYWQGILGKARSVGSTIYKYGTPIFEPVRWLSGKTSNFLYRKTTAATVYLVSMLQDYIPGVGPFAPLMAETFFSKLYVEFPVKKILEGLSTAFLSSLEIRTDDLPKNIYKRKDEIARRLFKRFEDQLPNSLKGGNAYTLYKCGHTAYRMVGHVRCIYNLVENLASVVSLTHQLANESKTKTETVITVIEIAQKCADSYISVLLHFDLNDNLSNIDSVSPGEASQQKMGWFLWLASWFIPIQKYKDEFKSLKTPFQQKVYLFAKLAGCVTPMKKFVSQPGLRSFGATPGRPSKPNPNQINEEMLMQMLMQEGVLQQN